MAADARLPGGIDAALRTVVVARRAGAAVDTLCALAAEVSPDARRGGLAAQLLGGMRELAARHGLRRLIAPVRPSWNVPHGLAPLHVDRAADRASYWEPNVWMVHPELT
jgi:GNAT superfamily N-acetyltransferase